VFGAFIGCSNYPECRYTRQMGRDEMAMRPAPVGTDPKTAAKRFAEDRTLRTLCAAREWREAAARRIPKGFAPETVDLEQALRLLVLAREIGLHPETEKRSSRLRPLRTLCPA